MKKTNTNNKRLLTLSTVFVAAFALASCGGTTTVESSSSKEEVATSEVKSVASSSSSTIESSSSSDLGPISVTNPQVIALTSQDQEGIELKAPFTIYTADGSTPELTTDREGTDTKGVPTSYENMYEAIRVAGNNSTSKNILQVQDANNVQIYKRTKKSECYVFDGDKYVGTAGSVTSKTYVYSHPESYAVNGIASDYSYLGRRDMVEDQEVTENVLETNAGAYNYMFSKGGSGGTDYGYRYASADIHLSEMEFRTPDDGEYWNPYIFFNLGGGISADLGLIGIKQSNKINWYLVRNCGSSQHVAATGATEKDAKFYVYQDTNLYPGCLVTGSTSYDSSTGIYSGFDDLHFEAFMEPNGFILNITNLRTKAVSSFSDLHTENGKELDENINISAGRVLVAASYCPVTGNVWDWHNGAKMTGVTWDNIEIKKALVDGNGDIDTDIDHYRAAEGIEFYPGSEPYRDGYSQGGYCSSFEYGTHESDGEYQSGVAYKAGQKYLTLNVEYKAYEN